MPEERLKTRVESFVDRLEREDVCMHGFVLSVGGAIKAAAYYAPFAEGAPHRMYSVSKTITALAVGILLDEGRASLDDAVAGYFADYLPSNPDPRLMRLTLRDMLRMATCHRSTAYREGVDENWTRPFFTVPPTHEPGTVFHYDTGCAQVLAALVRRLSGREVIDFMTERVFEPLGATDPKRWLRDPSGACQGGTGLCMSLRDLHKVARLVMEGGGGLLPSWFCREMGKPHSLNPINATCEEGWGYGWQVWMTRCGWAMYGLGGQLAIVCPQKDALLCTIADTRLDPVGVRRIYSAFFDEVYPYIGREDMPPLTLRPRMRAVAHVPAFERAQAGPYFFEAGNPLGLKSVRLRGHALLLENARGRSALRFGVGENIAGAFPGWSNRPALASGGWLAEGVLRVRCHIVDDAPCGVDMLLVFKGDSLTVQSRRSADPATEGYEGVASGYVAKTGEPARRCG